MTLAEAEEFDAAIAGLDLGSSVVGHGLGITVSLDGQARGATPIWTSGAFTAPARC